MMGKLVWDTMRGVDFLLTRDDIDSSRLGVSGNSLGGAKAGDERELLTKIKTAIDAGGAGVAMGRNIIQAEDPALITAAVVAVVHNGATVDEALALLAAGA